jgi:hypothetical protein
MTTDRERALDAAYKPFPPFAEWLEGTAVTDSRWERYRLELDSYPKEQYSAFAKAREIAQRAAAFDTGAIEGLYETDRGFTYSVAFEIGAWQAALDAKGGNVRSLFEAQLTAYESLLDLATKAENLTEAAIRTLHAQIVAAQDTYLVHTAVGPQEQKLPKGRYKIYSNHVRTRDGLDHSYAPAELTPAEMNRLVEDFKPRIRCNRLPTRTTLWYASILLLTAMDAWRAPWPPSILCAPCPCRLSYCLNKKSNISMRWGKPTPENFRLS